MKVVIVVPSGCHNKIPHTLWLKTAKIFSLTNLVSRSLKSRRAESVPYLFQLLLVASSVDLGPNSNGCLCFTLLSLCLFSLLCVSYKAIHHLTRVPPGNPHLNVLTLITCAKTLFLNKVTLTGYFRGVGCERIFCRTTIQPTTVVLDFFQRN